jgi:hypothetical protein
LPGLYFERPSDLNELASLKERYVVSFPLAAANKQKIIEQIGTYPVTDFSKPKFMRTEHNVRGEFLGWHLIDTDNWQRHLVSVLDPEQKKLSPWGIWNDTLLVEKLVNDWKLEDWG